VLGSGLGVAGSAGLSGAGDSSGVVGFSGSGLGVPVMGLDGLFSGRSACAHSCKAAAAA
jgi:hypothetical protein